MISLQLWCPKTFIWTLVLYAQFYRLSLQQIEWSTLLFTHKLYYPWLGIEVSTRISSLCNRREKSSRTRMSASPSRELARWSFFQLIRFEFALLLTFFSWRPASSPKRYWHRIGSSWWLRNLTRRAFKSFIFFIYFRTTPRKTLVLDLIFLWPITKMYPKAPFARKLSWLSNWRHQSHTQTRS